MKQYAYALIVSTLFFAELVAHAFCLAPVAQLLLCWYIASLYSTTHRSELLWNLTLTAAAASLISLLLYNSLSTPLYVLVPATIIGIKAQRSFYLYWLQPYLVLFGCLVFQLLYLDTIPFQIKPFSLGGWYTYEKFIANIIVLGIMIFSLKRIGSRQAGQSLVRQRMRGKSGLQTNRVP